SFVGGSRWNIAFPPSLWQDGTTYYFGLQAQDAAGNWMATGTTTTFVVDFTTPTITVNLPSTSEGTYRPFATISGVAIDSYPVVVTSVTFSAAGAQYWNGVDWTGSSPKW